MAATFDRGGFVGSAFEVDAVTSSSSGTLQGAGVASATGTATAVSSATAQGAGTAAATGASTATVSATAQGVGAATATGAAAAAASVTAQGVGAASAVGAANALTVGTAQGAGTAATAVGAASVEANGTAQGVSTATGFSPVIVAVTSTGGGGSKWRDAPARVRTGGRSGAKVTTNVTDDELRVLYERIMGLSPEADEAPVPAASKKVQAKVRKAIKDYAVTAELAAGIVPTQYIDWASVAQDMQTVDILLQAAQRAVWDEEEAVMALLLAS